jgi:hypothetical protein
VIRASTSDELVPLLALCREGKLFEVQDWIRQGRPVALQEDVGARGASRNPLRIAIDSGFHSLVEILLEAGAPQRERGYCALHHVVDLRRVDLAELLFRYGAKVEDVPMQFVLESWTPEMVDLFLSHGASLERGHPVAWALIAKIRTTLRLLKRDDENGQDLQAQGGIALRYHANEGNTKWVSLLLWAGADPCERGIFRLEDLEENQEEEDSVDHGERPNAVELAVMAGKLEVLKLPRMIAASRPPRQPAGSLVEHASYQANLELLSFILAQGHLPSALPDRGTRAINRLLRYMTFGPSVYSRFPDTKSTLIDSSHARERMKAVHMLLAHGAMWLPKEPREIGDVRRSLLKMKAAYLLEFVWLLRAYRAARRRDVLELFRTPSVNRLLGDKRTEADRILAGIPEDTASVVTSPSELTGANG